MILHEADRNREKPLVFHAPVEGVFRVVGTIPGVNFNILVRRHFISDILIKESFKPAEKSA